MNDFTPARRQAPPRRLPPLLSHALFALALLAGGHAGAVTTPSANAAANAPASGEATPDVRTFHVATPDGRIYVETRGKGLPVVIIPGGPGGSHTAFKPWLHPLAAGRQLVLFDNLGRGRSDRLADPARYTVERDADDIEAVRAALGAEQIAVVGHSYGGLVAQAYALKYRAHVAALVLSSTYWGAEGFRFNSVVGNTYLREQYPERWERILALRARGLRSAAPEYQSAAGDGVGDLYWYDRSNAARVQRSPNPADRFNPDVYHAMLGDDPEWELGGTLAGVDFRPRLAKLQVPTLVIAGRHDRIAPPRFAREIAAALPAGQATLRIFEKSGHRPFIEETIAYLEALTTFLKAHGC